MNNTPIEDRKLLYRDLCARKPYGVKVQLMNAPAFGDAEPIFSPQNLSSYKLDMMGVWAEGSNLSRLYKPYLFHLSSMTEEQKDELVGKHLGYYQVFDGSGRIFFFEKGHEVYDWLNAHHFDYRGLIEKGLAIDATGKNIY